MPRRPSTEDDYVTRIDRVIDHIHARYAEPLTLPTLARIARFSPYHFHRVFRAHTGETLRAFVSRVRVQRAALLLGRAMTKTKLIEVALSSGFGSAAELSRAFRETFDMSPTEFRRSARMRKNAQEPSPLHAYLPRHERSRTESPIVVARVRRPSCHLAYVRVQNPFADTRLADAASRLDAYARAHRLESHERLGLSLDDPELTAPTRARYDLAVCTDGHAPVAGGVSRRELDGGWFAEVHAHGDVADIARAWDRLFAEWLPDSGYEPGDGPGLERYLAPPDFVAWSGFDVVLALPIVRARHAR